MSYVDTPVPAQTTKSEIEDMLSKFGVPMPDVHVTWDVRTGAALGNPEAKQEMEKRMSEVNAAYELLGKRRGF